MIPRKVFLTGRTEILKLLPFSLYEINKLGQVSDFSYEDAPAN